MGTVDTPKSCQSSKDEWSVDRNQHCIISAMWKFKIKEFFRRPTTVKKKISQLSRLANDFNTDSILPFKV